MKINGLTVDKATADETDIEPIFALSKELIDTYENIGQIDYARVLAWVKNKIESNIGSYTKLTCGENTVGYFRVCEAEGMTELDDLYILPDYRCRGIGTEVIKKCVAESDKTVFLYVFIRNVRAVSLYTKLGFTVTRVIGDSRYVMSFEKNK